MEPLYKLLDKNLETKQDTTRVENMCLWFRLLSVLVLFLTMNTCLGQQPIVGKWMYAGVQPVDSDPWSQKMIDIMIGKDSYKHFFSNNLYTVYENEKTTHGRWKLLDDGSKLMTLSFDGSIKTFEIIKITSDTLVILGRKKIYGTLIKDASADDTSFVNDMPQNSISDQATTKQLTKKWVLIDSRLTTTPTPEEKTANRIFTNVLRSSWYDFKPGGVVVSKFTKQQEMKWYFENDKRSIVIIDSLGDGSLWNILSISDSQLILQKPHAMTQLIFEADEN